jgi:hypothetical protein
MADLNDLEERIWDWMNAVIDPDNPPIPVPILRIPGTGPVPDSLYLTMTINAEGTMGYESMSNVTDPTIADPLSEDAPYRTVESEWEYTLIVDVYGVGGKQLLILLMDAVNRTDSPAAHTLTFRRTGKIQNVADLLNEQFEDRHQLEFFGAERRSDQIDAQYIQNVEFSGTVE